MNDERENLSPETEEPKKFKTPQEKKALSYAKDGRNAYGQHDKASRKAIKLNKLNPKRAYRRNVEQLLQSEIKETDVENLESLETKVREIKRRRWRKYPDVRLGEYVKSRSRYRKKNVGAKAERRATREKNDIT